MWASTLVPPWQPHACQASSPSWSGRFAGRGQRGWDRWCGHIKAGISWLSGLGQGASPSICLPVSLLINWDDKSCPLVRSLQGVMEMRRAQSESSGQEGPGEATVSTLCGRSASGGAGTGVDHVSGHGLVSPISGVCVSSVLRAS